MYLSWRQVRRGEAMNVVLVAALSFGKRLDRELGAAVGNVVGLGPCGELLIGGEDDVVDGFVDLRGEPALFRFGEGCGKLLERQEEGVGGDDAVALLRDLGSQELDGDEVVGNAGAQNGLGLGEGGGDLVQAGNVVLVMLD